MSDNPLTASREALTAALEPEGFTVYPSPPLGQITTPAAVLSPGSPWATAVTWSRTEVRWLVSLAAGQLGEGEATAQRLEDLAWSAMGACRQAGFAVGEVSQPRSARYGQAEVAMADMEIRVQVDD